VQKYLLKVEVSLSNAKTTFEHQFPSSALSADSSGHSSGKLESPYFAFGAYDWSLSVYPAGGLGRTDSQIGE